MDCRHIETGEDSVRTRRHSSFVARVRRRAPHHLTTGRLAPERGGVGDGSASEKSLALTQRLVELLVTTSLTGDPYGYCIGTPSEPARCGGHIVVEHDVSSGVARALKRWGVIPDFRPPDVVRLVPIPLYTSDHDIWQAVGHLREIMERGEHLADAGRREIVA